MAGKCCIAGHYKKGSWQGQSPTAFCSRIPKKTESPCAVSVTPDRHDRAGLSKAWSDIPLGRFQPFSNGANLFENPVTDRPLGDGNIGPGFFISGSLSMIRRIHWNGSSWNRYCGCCWNGNCGCFHCYGCCRCWMRISCSHRSAHWSPWSGNGHWNCCHSSFEGAPQRSDCCRSGWIQSHGSQIGWNQSGWIQSYLSRWKSDPDALVYRCGCLDCCSRCESASGVVPRA